MCCLRRNKILVWTQNVGLNKKLGAEWVAPPFVSYASSCLFTSIQCPQDPRRLSSNGFFFVLTQTNVRNVLSRAADKPVLVPSSSSSCRMGWSPAVMCVSCGVLWAGELEAVWSLSLSSTAPPMDTTMMSLERQWGDLLYWKECAVFCYRFTLCNTIFGYFITSIVIIIY